MKKLSEQIVAANLASYGVIVNTFEELESAYVKEYKKSMGRQSGVLALFRFVTTPLNVIWLKPIINCAIDFGLPIQLV